MEWDSSKIFRNPKNREGGISIDRDLNASLNILNIGLSTLGHSGIYACEDGSLELSLKQEKECLVN